MVSSGARTSSMGCWGSDRRQSKSRAAPFWKRTMGSSPATLWTLQTSDDTWRDLINQGQGSTSTWNSAFRGNWRGKLSFKHWHLQLLWRPCLRVNCPPSKFWWPERGKDKRRQSAFTFFVMQICYVTTTMLLSSALYLFIAVLFCHESLYLYIDWLIWLYAISKQSGEK